MSILIIALLLGLSGYLGVRLHASVTENLDLRKNIAFLKKRLAQQ
jgi:hypothetical protein